MKKEVGKEKLVLFGVPVFGLLIGLLGYFALVVPQTSRSQRLDSQIEAAQAQLVAAARQPAKKPAPPPSVDAADIFRLTKAMPDSTDLAGVLEHLTRLARASSATVESVAPAAVVPFPSGYGALPLSVVVSGGFGAVSSFLQQLRQQVSFGKKGDLHVDGRLLVVNNVQLATTTGSSLTATLSIDAFVYGVAPPTTTSTTTTTSGN